MFVAIGFQCLPVEVWEEVGMRVNSVAARHGEVSAERIALWHSERVLGGSKSNDGLSRRRAALAIAFPHVLA